MKLSTMLTAVTFDGDVHQAISDIVAWESAGLDMAWVAEGSSYDAPTLLAYLAARTQQLELGTSILNVFSRTPGTILQTIAGLDRLSNGRAHLGLGVSVPSFVEGFHGVAYREPLERLREVVHLVRQGLAGHPLHSEHFPIPLTPATGAATSAGVPFALRHAPLRSEVPMWVAALGPHSVAQCAEIADGWIPFLFHPDRYQDAWGEALAAGLSRRAPGRAPLQIVAGGLAAVCSGSTETELLGQARAFMARYIGGMGTAKNNAYYQVACRYGYKAEAAQVQRFYQAGNLEAAAASIPLEWVRATNLIGSPAWIQDRIAAYAQAGVTVLNISPVGPDPATTVAAIKSWLAN